MGFQVLVPTSFPVINKVAGWIGIHSTLAVPGNQLEYYARFQIWFGFFVALISGTGQFFWWRRLNAQSLRKELMLPVTISVVLWVIVVVAAQITSVSFLALTFSGIYVMVANGGILYKIRKLCVTHKNILFRYD